MLNNQMATEATEPDFHTATPDLPMALTPSAFLYTSLCVLQFNSFKVGFVLWFYGFLVLFSLYLFTYQFPKLAL